MMSYIGLLLFLLFLLFYFTLTYNECATVLRWINAIHPAEWFSFEMDAETEWWRR